MQLDGQYVECVTSIRIFTETVTANMSLVPIPHNSKKSGISVVIPIYGSEKILPLLVERLERVLHEAASVYEIVLVNDCSPDRSWEVLVALTEKKPAIRAINLMRNFGQHNALLCGIRAAQFDTIVTMDDDLQHPPEEIPKLLAVLDQSNCDVVYGTPTRQQHRSSRNLATFIAKLALRTVMESTTVRDISAFRAFRSQVAAAFRDYEAPFVSIDVLLAWGTGRFKSVPVRFDPRREGASGYTLLKLISYTLNLVTGFTALPLRVASILGFSLSVVGFAILAYVLVRYLVNGNPVPGFPFLASIVAIFSGAQLFTIGIIGEYLARMHFRTVRKPTYVIREYLRGQKEDEQGVPHGQ
jgi:glycosyltransferase involved in cell wall biosynthesis